jgi:hypothetical protein
MFHVVVSQMFDVVSQKYHGQNLTKISGKSHRVWAGLYLFEPGLKWKMFAIVANFYKLPSNTPQIDLGDKRCDHGQDRHVRFKHECIKNYESGNSINISTTYLQPLVKTACR